MIKILLAEDHALVREGLKLLLSLEPGMEVVAETGDGAAVERLVREARPDLLLLDLDLPGCHGVEVAERIKRGCEGTKILVLTGSLQPDSVRGALAAGADGYVVKREEGTELLQAIRAVMAGTRYVSRGTTAFEQSEPDSPPALGTITSRELEIMRMIAHGLTSQDIALKLEISVLTVRKHRENLMRKLQLRNTAELTAFAIRHRLMSA